MTWLLLSLYSFSPADSCARMVTLEQIPEQAVLYAELASRQGGDGPLLFGRMLELAGRFEDAALVYQAALASASDPLTGQWLRDRIRGVLPLDTILVLRASVTNLGTTTARGLLLVMPEPGSHPPYQRIDLLGGAFRADSGLLLCRLDSLPGGRSAVMPVFLHIVQRPFSFRPLPDSAGGFPLEALADVLRSVRIPDEYEGGGPCLSMSMEAMRTAAADGIGLDVVGGIVRRGDSLVFHAWDVLREGIPGMPADPLLFKTDSLRAFGHCPTDVIPLWDMMATGGHELSILFPEQEADLSISLTAFFEPSFTNGWPFPPSADAPPKGDAR